MKRNAAPVVGAIACTVVLPQYVDVACPDFRASDSGILPLDAQQPRAVGLDARRIVRDVRQDFGLAVPMEVAGGHGDHARYAVFQLAPDRIVDADQPGASFSELNIDRTISSLLSPSTSAWGGSGQVVATFLVVTFSGQPWHQASCILPFLLSNTSWC